MTEKHAVEQWMRDAYPAPWSVEVHPSLNRSTVKAADGGQVISGMNNAKAALIVEAVNSFAAQQIILKRAKRLCDEALPKFNWGGSALDANAIQLLNEVPGEIARAISKGAGK